MSNREILNAIVLYLLVSLKKAPAKSSYREKLRILPSAVWGMTTLICLGRILHVLVLLVVVVIFRIDKY